MQVRLDVHMILKILELLADSDVGRILAHPNPDSINEFRQAIKARRKQLAKKYHPDVNGGSAERMKQINAVCDAMLSLRISRAQLPPVVVRVYQGAGSWGNNDSTGTATGFNY